jgi:acetyl-CoA carboxylase biotin carboxylase subunit
MFQKVLIANRGEIAVRLIRGLREMGVASVAVYSDADRSSLHVRMADEAVHVGPSASSESYLKIDAILGAARKSGAEAIHPGYGFLSENAAFAEACEDAGIVFIGPRASAIRSLGSKIEARKIAEAAGAPVVPGTTEAITSISQAKEIASLLGYPVLLKASAGGGGKGMRRVDAESALESAMRDASSEAERAFRNGEIYLEKFVEEPRHIEIQILGDLHGNLVHLGERECSLQRRHQKVIEECPSPLVALHPEMRSAMGEAALRVARAAGYSNAGTAEFLVDKHRNFYFLEMNTRLQVEHPVTELATGLDLVHLQLRIAAGEPLPFKQEEITWRGSAIECRVYAEDPDNQFLPSPGRIAQLREPQGPGIRLDSGVYPGWTVPFEYDPLLAKLAAWGSDRLTAIARLDRALAEYSLTGIRHNIFYFREILADAEFREGRLNTGFLAEFETRRRPRKQSADMESLAALAAAHAERPHRAEPLRAASSSGWVSAGRAEMMR